MKFRDSIFTDIPNKDAAGNLDGSMKGTISVVSLKDKKIMCKF